jgi:TatD DNase family protein
MGIKMLPFDAHSHVHMGPASSLQELLTLSTPCLSGMALMSTHPRDFPRVLELAKTTTTSDDDDDDDDDANNNNNNNNNNMQIIPCIGVHPWFLHELSSEDCEILKVDDIDDDDDDVSNSDDDSRRRHRRPKWVHTMQSLLEEYPNIPVGEIGLDKFHFDYDTGELTTPIDVQMQAMEYQMELASSYQRPVSVHCVRAMGPLMDVLKKCSSSSSKKKTQKQKTQQQSPLPPKIYFHAFGGKVGTATQLIKMLEKNNKNKSSKTKTYFGFAPIVNFQSPKTIQVLQEVGLERIVLETDHEDAAKVASSMKLGLQIISKAFGITEEELIAVTNQNVRDLYSIDAAALLPTTTTTV